MMLTAKDLTDGHEPVSHEEIDYLKELAKGLPPKPLIVNIGAATGVSTLAFLEARPDCLIYSVDVLPCEEELLHVRQGGHEVKKVIRLLGDSKEIGPGFPYLCDLIFIDGDHWGAGADIDAWVMTGKVRAGGVVAFHDYQEVCPPWNPGSVCLHVSRWHEAHPEFELLGRVDRVIAYRKPGGKP
jgi:predicted O-methyltransferase YrrM